jgi:hypothetical protein
VQRLGEKPVADLHYAFRRAHATTCSMLITSTASISKCFLLDAALRRGKLFIVSTHERAKHAPGRHGE